MKVMLSQVKYGGSLSKEFVITDVFCSFIRTILEELK